MIEVGKNRAGRLARVGTCAGVCLIFAAAASSPTTLSRKQSAKRIVSLVPHATEILFALGAGDRVVGVGDGCLWPQEARTKPRVGGVFDLKIEEIAALEPDLVLLSKSHVLHRQPLAERGIPYRIIETNSINGAFATMQDLAILVDRYEAGRKLILPMVDELNALYQANSRLERRRTLLCVDCAEESMDPVLAVAPGNYFGELLAVAGAKNVAIPPNTEDDIVFPMSREAVRQAKPQVVIDVFTAKEPSAAERQRIEGQWREMFSADPEPPRRVYVIYDPYLPVPGTRIAESVRKVSAMVHY